MNTNTTTTSTSFTLQDLIAARRGIATKIRNAVIRLRKHEVLIKAHASCIGHSGGKDSVVNHFLVTHAFPNISFPVVHTAKPGGDNAIHPDTLEFLYQQPFAIELWPRALGHNPKYNLQFDGSRVSEKSRTDRSANYVQHGQQVNRESLQFLVPDSMFGMTFVFPFYDWDDADVWACIHLERLPFSKEYAAETQLLNELTEAML